MPDDPQRGKERSNTAKGGELNKVPSAPNQKLPKSWGEKKARN